MSYYPAWLDYVAWPLGIAGAICAFITLSEPSGKKRGLLKLNACVLISTAVGIAAIEGYVFNARAAHITTHGVITEAEHHSGKNAYTNFYLIQSADSSIGLHISGDIAQLTNGTVVEITYQADSNQALFIEILQGPFRGYHFTDSDGMTGAVFSLVLAFGLLGYGVLDWFNDGNALQSEPDNGPAPDGDVDTQSMLNL